MKLVHALPAAFFLGNIGLVALGFVWWPLWCLLALPAVGFFIDALVATKQLRVALLAVPAAFVQLCGYGCGFCDCFLLRVIFGKGEYARFVKNFYKK